MTYHVLCFTLYVVHFTSVKWHIQGECNGLTAKHLKMKQIKMDSSEEKPLLAKGYRSGLTMWEKQAATGKGDRARARHTQSGDLGQVFCVSAPTALLK